MAETNSPTAAELRQLFYYDVQTERLIRLRRPRSSFPSDSSYRAWNTRFAGTSPKYETHNGYAALTIAGRKWLAHRAIWAVFYGEDPPEIIDHANRNRSDNRIKNLRSATASQNAHNKKVVSSSRSGIKGIYLESETGRWKAQIRIDGKKTHLGRYPTSEQAAQAYRIAAKKHYGDYAEV